MVELCRANDPAGLSWMRAPFAAAAGHGVVFDSHGLKTVGDVLE